MISANLFGITIIWLKRGDGTQDSHGNDVPTWTPQPIPGCAFAPRSTFEDNQGRDMTIFGGVVYLPPGYAISSHDRFQIGADTYEIDGPPSHWDSPKTGSRGGIQVSVSHITG